MSEKLKAKPPVWFWIVSVITLLWNGWGVNMYLQQAYNTESYRAMYPDPEMLELANNTPAWATAAYAIAVFAGLFEVPETKRSQAHSMRPRRRAHHRRIRARFRATAPS